MLLLYITTNSVVGNLAFLIYQMYLIYNASLFLAISLLKWTFLRLNIRKHMIFYEKNLKYFLWLCNISIHLLYKYILVKLNAFLNVANQLILIITPECLKVLKLWEILRIFARKKTYKTRTSRKVNSFLKITYPKYSNTAFISIGSSRAPSNVNVLVSRHSPHVKKHVPEHMLSHWYQLL